MNICHYYVFQVDTTSLRNIRNRHRQSRDTEAMKTDMLIEWIDNAVDLTWSAVVRALVGIKMKPLAKTLGMKYGKE